MDFFDFFKNAIISLFAYLMFSIISSEKKAFSRLTHIFEIGLYVSVMTVLLTVIFSSIIEPLKSILVIVVLSLLKATVQKKPVGHIAFYLSISYAFSCFLYAIAAFGSSAVFVFGLRIEGVNIYIGLTTLVIESALMFLIYKRKFKFTITHRNLASAGTAISGIVLIIYSLFRESEIQTKEFIYLFSGIVLCGLGLYWWLKKESIANFNDKAQEIRTEKLKGKIAELTDNNLELEKIIHTDSKKLPAYRKAVVQTIATGDEKAKKALFDGLVKASAGMAVEYGASVPLIGLPTLLEAILDFYKGLCQKSGINFKLNLGDNVEAIAEAIPQSSLETLIANLLDNAIKAFRGDVGNDKYVLVRLWATGISVEDNGVAFTDSVLADMERCKESLTPNRGEGVGLGYVTMFEITNECRASVEVTQEDGVKSVTVRFDGENRLVIAYYKGEEVKG